MPIVNGQYVSPTWQNGGPPPIDQTELQAITDTLQNLDTGGQAPAYTAGNGISILNSQILARMSSQSGNTATFGPDGGIYVPTSAKGNTGKKYATFVIGTSTAGWTEADCDYLCDGTEDDVEFNDAISNFPDIGGEIVVLPGQYNISNTINMSGIVSSPAGCIRGAGSWTRSVHLVWTGQYTSSAISTGSSSTEKYSIMNIYNGSVSNIFFDMNNASAASGNIGVSLGTLGVCKNCYFLRCPTSVKCVNTATVRNCYIGSSTGTQTYGIYATGGYVLNNYCPSLGFEYAIYTNTGRYTATIISGNLLDSTYSGAGGITCSGYGTATLVSNNILVNCTITDNTTTYHATIVNNIEC